MIEVVVEELEVDIVEKIEKTRGKNKKVFRVIEEMKKIGVKVLREDKWQIERELVLKKKSLYTKE